MKMKKTTIIMSHIFITAFVVCITAAAFYFNKVGLLWWYLLPAFIAFCNVVGSSGEAKEKQE